MPYKTKEGKAAWRLKNKVRLTEYNRSWYQGLSPEKKAEYQAYSRDKYRSLTPEEKRSRARKYPQDKAYGRLYLSKLRQIVIDGLGGKCAHCGYSDFRALCVDHVNGDGYRERLELSRGQILSKIRKLGFPSDRYQCLCANCNLIKAKENGELTGRPKGLVK